VFIAHRLRTIFDSDIIFVLKDGEVVESGTHPVLLEQQGVYSNLWAAQETSLGKDMELERNLEEDRALDDREAKP
jgi:ABC transporter ATM